MPNPEPDEVKLYYIYIFINTIIKYTRFLPQEYINKRCDEADPITTVAKRPSQRAVLFGKGLSISLTLNLLWY